MESFSAISNTEKAPGSEKLPVISLRSQIAISNIKIFTDGSFSNYLRWKISHDPHAAGTDKGNLRDAGETCACQIIIWISI